MPTLLDEQGNPVGGPPPPGGGQVLDEQGNPVGSRKVEEPKGFLHGVASTLLPSTNIEDYYKGPAYAATHPADAIKLLYDSMLDAHTAEAQRMFEAWGKGHVSEAVGHGAATLLPGMGPAAAAAGEKIGEGDTSTGLGMTAGLLAPSALSALRGKPVEAPVEKGVVPGAPPLPEAATGFQSHLIRNTALGRAVQEKVGKPRLEAAEAAVEHTTDQAVAKIEDSYAKAVSEAHEDFDAMTGQHQERMRKAAQNLATLGAAEPQAAGAGVKEKIAAGAKIGKAESARLYAPIDAAAEEAKVDIGPLKEDIVRMADKGDPLAVSLRKRVVGGGGAAELENLSPEEQRAYIQQHGAGMENFRSLGGEASAGMPDRVPWVEARALQRELAGDIKGPGVVSQNIWGGAAKGLWHTLTDQMRAGLDAVDPGLSEKFDKANAYWREYSDIFKRGVAAKAMKAYPEDVVGKLTISRVQALREAVIGYAERYGSPEEIAAGKDAWQEFGKAFIKKTFKGFPQDIQKALNDPTKREAMEELYKDSPGVMKNLYEISAVAQDEKLSSHMPDLIRAESIGEADKVRTESLKVVQERRAGARAKLKESLPAQPTGTGVGGLSGGYAGVAGAGNVAAAIAGHGREAVGGTALYMGGAELAGGLLAWTAYHPEATASLVRAIKLSATNPAGAARIVNGLKQSYLEEQKKAGGPPGPEYQLGEKGLEMEKE